MDNAKYLINAKVHWMNHGSFYEYYFKNALFLIKDLNPDNKFGLGIIRDETIALEKYITKFIHENFDTIGIIGEPVGINISFDSIQKVQKTKIGNLQNEDDKTKI
jgi:hypothetical protein